MVLGLQRGVVKIVPYQQEWAALYEEEKQRILAAISQDVLEIQHVGSTSIPGMPAKPILDMAIAVRSFEEAGVCIPPMEAIGYRYKGECDIPFRHYFVKDKPRTHQIHMVERGSSEWERMLLFRDFLRYHPVAAREYADLKLRLASEYNSDVERYTNMKGPFIEKIIMEARKALS